jgi:hypothetical protein
MTDVLSKVTAGDKWTIPVTLKVGGVPQSVSGATIVFGVVNDASLVQFGGSITVTETSLWAGGRVVCVVPAATTASIPAGQYHLDVRVTIAGDPQTYHSGAFLVNKKVLP